MTSRAERIASLPPELRPRPMADRGARRAQILDVLTEEMTPAELGRRLGIDRGNAFTQLRKLTKQGLVKKVARERYVRADVEAANASA